MKKKDKEPEEDEVKETKEEKKDKEQPVENDKGLPPIPKKPKKEDNTKDEKKPKTKIVDKFNQQLEHNKEEEVVENKTKKDDKPKALNKERQEQVMQMLNKGQLMYGGPNLMKRLSLKHENNQLLRKEMIEHTEIERVEEEKEIPPEVAPKPPKPKVTGTTTEVTNVIIDQETGMLESGRDRLVSKKKTHS